MAEFTRETTVTQGNIISPTLKTQVKNQASGYQTVEYLIYFFFGVLEILLVFRLILKLMGANTFSYFVGLIYGITGIFIMPFEGIFRMWFAQGPASTTSVFEPATLVAIVVYAVLAWGIVRLVQIFSGEKQQESV